ncbi:8627_t:CDS:2 [Entrophospora sp. SA101]|nr:2513_t:CDS:2 [Entrophospora sp. SA101]CAJ0745210.1 13209_t:CDS:2 [Entrophospora sp. SA101]CAJ0757942.1 8627_t:CDS:2 [Entrophospora sp. SA101]CAJ0828693.1 2442_t:CDS:2 [Entrophospora sp. SA101]CAJ0828704.1 2446_t:CDS:2 [Entrophospora sp. SA101]
MSGSSIKLSSSSITSDTDNQQTNQTNSQWTPVVIFPENNAICEEPEMIGDCVDDDFSSAIFNRKLERYKKLRAIHERSGRHAFMHNINI